MILLQYSWYYDVGWNARNFILNYSHFKAADGSTAMTQIKAITPKANEYTDKTDKWILNEGSAAFQKVMLSYYGCTQYFFQGAAKDALLDSAFHFVFVTLKCYVFLWAHNER